jgi:energy-coupling factor transporter transmembrane protein EcfT
MTIDSTILNSLLVVLASILLDMLMGVCIAIKTGTFSLSKLPKFLASNVVPYIGGLIILAVFANYVSEMEYLFYAGVGLVTVKFSKEALVDKLTTLFG